MEQVLISRFQDIDGVSDTRVKRNGEYFSVEVDLSIFDRPTRNKVFARERDLYQEFPSAEFDFCLVDVSPTDTEDALRPGTPLQG